MPFELLDLKKADSHSGNGIGAEAGLRPTY